MKWLIPNLHRQQLRQAAQYFAQQGVELLDLDGPEQLRDASGLLVWGSLASPLGYLASARVWQVWLHEHAPKTKLMVLSLTEASGAPPNVLDLLNLPAPLSERFEQAYDCSTTWVIPPTIGIDLRQRLDEFMVGHGNQSLMEAMGNLRKYLTSLDSEMHDQNLQEYQTALRRLEAKPERKRQMLDAWALLLDRWSRIAEYIPYLPFANQMNAAAAIIHKLKPYFESGLNDGVYYLAQHGYDMYDELYRIINNINNRYAR